MRAEHLRELARALWGVPGDYVLAFYAYFSRFESARAVATDPVSA